MPPFPDPIVEALAQLRADLQRIREALTGPQPDNRLWVPDSSCTPFSWESSVETHPSRILGQFAVRAGTLGVIRSIATAQAAVGNPHKENVRIVIARDRTPDFAQVSSECINLTGTLGEVLEQGSNEAIHYPGFVVPFLSGGQLIPRPVCIPLITGRYFVAQAGTTAVLSSQVALSGWTWRAVPVAK